MPTPYPSHKGVRNPQHSTILRLVNGHIYDVLNKKYHDRGTSLVIKGNMICSLDHPEQDGAQSDEVATVVDLKGGFAIPALFNTHCHISMGSPVFFPTLKDALFGKKYHETQIRCFCQGEMSPLIGGRCPTALVGNSA